MDSYGFLSTLFDSEDKTCFTADPTGTFVYSILREPPVIRDVYFSINALENRRSDATVTKHRTFLFEFDSMELHEQQKLLEEFPVPLSGAVFSGNKSIHFFVSLDAPVSREKYDELWLRIAAKLPPGVDKSTKNPSRLARVPNAIRKIEGYRDGVNTAIQTLLHVGRRVSMAELDSLAPPLAAPAYEASERDRALFVSTAIIAAKHGPNEVMQQMRIEGRNNFFHWFGQRLIEAKLPRDKRREMVDTAYANLNDKSGFGLREARMAARV